MDSRMHGVIMQFGLCVTVLLSMALSERYSRFLISTWYHRIDKLLLKDMVASAERMAMITTGFLSILGAMLNVLGRAISEARSFTQTQSIASVVLGFAYACAAIYVVYNLQTTPHYEYCSDNRWFSQRRLAVGTIVVVNVAQILVSWFL